MRATLLLRRPGLLLIAASLLVVALLLLSGLSVRGSLAILSSLVAGVLFGRVLTGARADGARNRPGRQSSRRVEGSKG